MDNLNARPNREGESPVWPARSLSSTVSARCSAMYSVARRRCHRRQAAALILGARVLAALAAHADLLERLQQMPALSSGKDAHHGLDVLRVPGVDPRDHRASLVRQFEPSGVPPIRSGLLPDHTATPQTLDRHLEGTRGHPDLLLEGGQGQRALMQQRFQDGEVGIVDSFARQAGFEELGERAKGARENDHELRRRDVGCLGHVRRSYRRFPLPPKQGRYESARSSTQST
jgi:hypothetical protein